MCPCIGYNFLLGLFLLLPHQIVVESLLLQKAFVRALLNDFPLIHHNNQIGIANRRQAMGDDESGAIQYGCVERFLYNCFAGGVQGAAMQMQLM